MISMETEFMILQEIYLHGVTPLYQGMLVLVLVKWCYQISLSGIQGFSRNPIATIDLDADNDGIDDILTIDNIAETATFTYENLTNPSLTDGDPVNEGFTGIGGDTIVTVTTNQQISATSPVPTIDFEYNTS